MTLNWVKVASGDWWLFDKPRGTPRHPVATISGFVRIGYTASVHSGLNAGTREHGKSIPALKRKLEGYLT